MVDETALANFKSNDRQQAVASPIEPVVSCDFEQIGWIMWDGDASNGYDDAFMVFGKTNPVKSEGIQKEYGGDHQGHIWKSEAVYKKSN